MKLTTTFNKLKLADACGQEIGSNKGYDQLANYLGGVSNYGKDKPINLLTILDSNGVDDCLWCLSATVEDSKEISIKLANEFADHAVKESLKTCEDPQFIEWANKWLSGEDRSLVAARTAAEVARTEVWAEAWAEVWAEAWAARTVARTAARTVARTAAWAAEAAVWAAEAAARTAAEAAVTIQTIEIIVREHLTEE